MQNYIYLLFGASSFVLFIEFYDYRHLKKKIYNNISKSSRCKRRIRNNNIMIIYSNYKALPKEDFKIAKLNLRAITPNTMLKQSVTTIFAVLPIVLAMMSLLIAASSGLMDSDSRLEQLSRDLNNMLKLGIVIIAVSFVYSVHLVIDQRRRALLQSHLTAINEVERELNINHPSEAQYPAQSASSDRRQY